MSLSMHQASVPVFLQMLNNLSAILDKADAYAGNHKIDPGSPAQLPACPDMFPFVRQIQVAADLAKGAAARLAGVEVPKHDDTEKTFADLKARITNTATFVQSIQPRDIDGSEGRDITLTLGDHTLSFKGQPYLLHFVLPNFYFHCTTAYDILRHCGVELANGISSELSEQGGRSANGRSAAFFISESTWADMLASTLTTLDRDIDAHDPPARHGPRPSLVFACDPWLAEPSYLGSGRGDVAPLLSRLLTQERRLRFPSFRVLWHCYSAALAASLA